MKSKPLQAETCVAPQELARRLAAGLPAEIIDVRTPPEYAAAHLALARLEPLDRLVPETIARQRADNSTPLYVICQSGARAAKAIGRLRERGIENCILVEGGTQAWMDAGLPVVRGESRVLPLMRQVQIVAGTLSAAGAALALAIDKEFALIPLLVGCGLAFAGLSGTCGMALLLAKMPWNRQAGGSPVSCSK